MRNGKTIVTNYLGCFLKIGKQDTQRNKKYGTRHKEKPRNKISHQTCIFF